MIIPCIFNATNESIARTVDEHVYIMLLRILGEFVKGVLLGEIQGHPSPASGREIGAGDSGFANITSGTNDLVASL